MNTLPPRAHGRAASRSNTSASPPEIPTAVLIDGTALFLTSRSLFESRQLDYRRLVQVLHEHVRDLRPSWASGPKDIWTMWTSASAQNEKQGRFLDFAENDLRWDIRRFSPAESYMVDPSAALGLGADSRLPGRFMRFDAQLAFAAGRLAEDHRLVVLSDSFTLADPLKRAAAIGTPKGRRPVLAFFSRALDPRWQRILRTERDVIEFVDFDELAVSLFGEDTAQPYREEPKPASFVY